VNVDYLRLEGLGPDDWRSLLGRKVSVRYAIYDDPEHRVTEAIGMVSAVGDEPGTTISLVNRRGETTTFALKHLVAGKAFPPSRPDPRPR
jgi:hypothetical protein